MTGSAFLRDMLIRMGGVSLSAFRAYFAGDERLSPFVTLHEERLPVILQEIGKDAFWRFCARHDWLTELLPPNGDHVTISWPAFSPHLPEVYDHPVNDRTFIEALKLFVWLSHSGRYAHFTVVISAPKKKADKSRAISSSVPAASGQSTKATQTSRSGSSRRYRDEDRSLNLYLKEIGDTPIQTAAEEVFLGKRIQQGDPTALDRLTKANLRFVVSVAKQYQNQGLSLADLIEEGNIGCVKAAKRWDYTRGFKFISYAVWWIRQAILQALAEQSRIVRLPLNRVGVLHKIGKTAASLEQDLGRGPTPEEIAREMEISESEVSDTLKISNTHLSLDTPFSTSEENSLIDVLEDEATPPPDEQLLKQALREEIEASLETLTPREAEVVELYFGLGNEKALTLEEIGIRFSLTRERVRQIKEKAIRRLRHASRIRPLAKRGIQAGIKPNLTECLEGVRKTLVGVVREYEMNEM